ncbi:MAG TPA: molybdenum cofactor biosynthesis protein B [Gammaproteobacteria bacterium]|nr:molybdenum cofactor biosynthesis protein B [Gammaproteobacteria bacterium]
MAEQQVGASLGVVIMTVSDTRSAENDTSGDTLAERAEQAGHRVIERCIVPDDIYRIRAEVSRWITDERVEVVLSTGGTGLTGRDGTPEAVTPLLDKMIDGFGEVFRAISFDEIGTSALQSRAIAGVANGTVVFCLPGSTGACRTGWDRLIREQLDIGNRPCNLAELMPRLRES